MIQIIKPGTRREETCPKCGCVFSFDEEDTYSNEPVPRYSGWQPVGKWVKCPQCDNEMPVGAHPKQVSLGSSAQQGEEIKIRYEK